MPKMAQGGIAQYAGGGSVYKNKPFKNKFPDGDAVVGSPSTTTTTADVANGAAPSNSCRTRDRYRVLLYLTGQVTTLLKVY